FNIKNTEEYQPLLREVPAVTGSVMMLRRNDFLAVGGFDEEYIYGYEDVDLCLSIKKHLNKKSICLTSNKVIHADGVTRKKTPSDITKKQRLNNIARLRSKFTSYVSRLYRTNVVTENPITFTRPTIAFAVTDVGSEVSAGDL